MCSCCFPASAKIWLETGSHLIPELRASDKLSTLKLDKNGKITPAPKTDSFYSYIHFDSEKVAEFLSIRCESNSELLVTGSHLVFQSLENGTCVPVPARNIQVGDGLVHLNENRDVGTVRVTQVGLVSRTGVYAPLTKSGTLVVDGFFVSCYADVQSHAKAHAALAPLRLWYRRKDHKKIKTTTKTNGIHSYATFLKRINTLLPMIKF